VDESLGVSIIVVNYNYGSYLAAAIDSALGQVHWPCEVIVVDDCSTDESQSIIAGYADRIRSVLLSANSGQIVAMNSAWPQARYPILMFLDADDLLLPRAASTIAGNWTAHTVKMQFPLVTIDTAGKQIGHVAPKYPLNLDTKTIRDQLLLAAGSPNSPGSGNAYARSFLDRLLNDGGFELANPREHHMDALLECNAPFYGEVVTLHEPLACYRVHGGNLYAVNSVDDTHFKMLLDTFAIKLDYLAGRCEAWGIPFNAAAVRARSPWALECELILSKLASARCTKGRRPSGKIYIIIKYYLGAPVPKYQRILRSVWCLCVFISPKPIARWLIALRFVASRRPAWFQQLRKVVKANRWRALSRLSDA
jgi:glycosyltransferase involved in cell wall biosynthesis